MAICGHCSPSTVRDIVPYSTNTVGYFSLCIIMEQNLSYRGVEGPQQCKLHSTRWMLIHCALHRFTEFYKLAFTFKRTKNGVCYQFHCTYSTNSHVYVIAAWSYSVCTIIIFWFYAISCLSVASKAITIELITPTVYYQLVVIVIKPTWLLVPQVIIIIYSKA